MHRADLRLFLEGLSWRPGGRRDDQREAAESSAKASQRHVRQDPSCCCPGGQRLTPPAVPALPARQWTTSLRYASYARCGRGPTILDERVLNGLDTPTKSLGVPTAPTAQHSLLADVVSEAAGRGGPRRCDLARLPFNHMARGSSPWSTFVAR